MLSATLLLFSILIFRRNTSSKSQPMSLSQLPGPPALPIIGHLHHLKSPLLHQNLHNLATKYGPLFQLRIGTMTAVTIASTEMAKEFLKNHDLEFAAHKPNLVIQRHTHGGSFSFRPYGKYVQVMRKLCISEFLGNHVLGKHLHVRVHETKCFLRGLLRKGQLGEEINFTVELTKMITNILSETMMGIRCSETEEGARQARIVHEVGEIFAASNLADFFPILKFFDVQGIKKKSEDIHKRYDEWIEGIMVKREEVRRKRKEFGGVNNDGEDSVRDFLDTLYDMLEDVKADNIQFNRLYIKGQLLSLFTAGTDTTVAAIEWTLAELMNNPKIMKKVQEEIDRVIGKERLVRESDIPNLPYMQAVMKETLRLHAPIPAFARVALQDCVVMGIKIPANTPLFVNVYSIGRDPNYWESPLEYKPERFLKNDATSARDFRGHDFEFLPFGTGRRGCPGMYLALQEVQTTLVAIIQCFDWKVTHNNGVVKMKERSGVAVHLADDLICVPMARIDNLETIIN